MVDLTNLNDVYRAGPDDNVVSGLDGDDDITGSGQVDTLFGGDGSDYLKGLAGDDLLFGGAGDDTIRADAGDDTLYGGVGSDILYGSDGNDVIFDGGTSGQDSLYGGNGDDVIYSEGLGFVGGGTGNDIITASVIGAGQVHLLGQSGDDTFNLDMANNSGTQGHHVYGGSGADTFVFTNLGAANHLSIGRIDDFDASVDRITLAGVDLHGNGAHLSDLPGDFMVAGVGLMRVKIVEYEQPGTGTIALGAQQFLAFGTVSGTGVNWLGLYALEGARRNGADSEEIHYANRGVLTSAEIEAMEEVKFEDQMNFVPEYVIPAYRYNMIEVQDQTITGTGGNDRIYAQDNANYTLRENLIYGGNGHDVIDGGKAEDIIYGGYGHDLIAGGLDNDILSGGKGDDRIFGGSEDDLIYGGSGADRLMGGGENDIIHGQSGSDKISGGTGDDSLYGGRSDDTIYGGAGDDRLSGGYGHDVLWAGAGNDKIFGNEGHDQLRGWGGVDHLEGGTGNDELDGGTHNDWLYGGNGNDVLIGGNGNDYLDGGDWADVLYGGSGSDRLIGGGSFDTFVFEDGLRSDRIVDFDSNDAEKVDFSAVSALGDFGDVLSYLDTNWQGYAVIDMGDGNKITFEGYTEADFGEGQAISAEDFIF